MSPRFSIAVITIAGVAAVMVSAFLDGKTGPARAHMILLLIGFQMIAAGLPLALTLGAASVAWATNRQRTQAFARALVPLVGLVKEITEAKAADKDQKRGQARVVALSAATTLLGGKDEIRASWFAVESTAPQRRLVPPPNSSVGRWDMAGTTFEETTPLGRTIFELLDRGEVGFCPNIETQPPVAWTTSPGALPRWKSFVSAPVIYKGQLLGMLTVDSLTPDDFDGEEDPPLAIALADLLAMAFKA